jgi:hypothetical protein
MNQSMPWDLLPAYVRPGGQADANTPDTLPEGTGLSPVRAAQVRRLQTVAIGFYTVAFVAGAYGGYRLVKGIAR